MKMSVTVLCLLLAAPVFPAEEQMEFLGFSPDGSRFALSIFGRFEGSAFTYGCVYIYDSDYGSVLDSLTSVDQTGDLNPDAVVRRLLTDNGDFLSSHGILPGDDGLDIEFPALDSPPGADMLHFSFEGSCRDLLPGLYSLDLFQHVTDSATVFFGIHPSTCLLQLTRAANSSSMELLDWESEPLLDEEVFHFSLEGLRLHPSGMMVIFLRCTVRGFEIPESRILIMTENDFSELENP